MDKSRAMPILAGAAMAFSLAACQGMGWGESDSGQSSSMQGSSSYPQSGSAQSAGASGAGGGMAQQQAAAPALVRDVQRSLGSRGYDPGAVDGVYGSGTESALRRFQRDQNLASSGQIDAPTLVALGLTNQAGAPQRSGAAYTPTNQRQGAMAAPSGQVRDVQQSLADRGYDAGPVDGRMGPRTRQALRDFQRDRNLQASGQPDQRTLAALGIEAGGAGTQTGEMPAEQQGEAPPPPDVPAQVPAQGQQIPEQQGELPPTGSQAPGSAPEATRTPGIPGQEEPPPASGPAEQ